MMPLQISHAKTYVFVILMIVFGSVGNVLLRFGMMDVGEIKKLSVWAIAHLFVGVFGNGWIWLGIGSLLLNLACLLLVLTWADYSFVSPVSGLGYGLVTFLGYALLGEAVTGVRWAGVACICLGVTFISRTPPRTSGQN